ncbi:MAG: PAS domain S-box protein [Dehalococcoidales bacterium]|nr:PAS domain S-box protein [Dehalococcoidales bacterium]
MKILIVDDNDDSRTLLAKQLRSYNHDIITAADGVMALEQALQEPPDVIISDILMPRMDGYQLCQACKQNEQLKKIPFIIYTATYTLEEDRKFALSLGAAEFLIKPVEPDTLIRILHEQTEKTESGELPSTEVSSLESSLFSSEHDKRVSAKLEAKITELENEINQRKQKEAELRIEKDKAEKYLNISDIMFLVIDRNQKVSLVNRKGSEILGYKIEEIIGKNWFDHYIPERYQDEVKATFTNLMAGNMASVDYYEYPILTRSGDKRIIAMHSTILTDETGNITGTLSSGEDITERKKLEQSTEKANRALRLISLCNQTMIHSTEEKQLLNEVCRLIVEEGGYRLAWVGFPENNEEKTVRPAAQNGYEEGYLETARISWADTERGRGPTGTVIRTGKPYVVEDVRNDPGYAPWRAEAEKRGYASVISLPLNHEGKTFGALTIDAAETNAFEDEEINLLVEMANDLAYGITSLRNHQERENVQERYRILFESAAEGILIVDAETKVFYYANPAICEMLGFSQEELTGMSVMDIHPEDILDVVLGEYKTLVTRGKTLISDIPCLKKDGTRIFASISSTIADIDGKQCVIGFFTDITQRRFAELFLKESEERYRTLFETMSQGVVYQSASGEIVMANPAAERILGLTVDQMMGRTSGDPQWRSIHEDGTDFPGEEHPSMIALKTGKPVTDVIMGIFHHPENRYHWIAINAIPLFNQGEEKPYQVYTTFTDITERYLAEAEINRMNRELLYFASQVPGMIYQFKRYPDGTYTIPYTNEAIREIFGCTPEDVREDFTPIGNVIIPEDLQKMIDSIEASARDLTPWELEFRVQVPGKEVRIIWERSIPDKQEDNSIIWFGFAADITEREKAEEELLLRAQLLDNASDGICLFDQDGYLIYANDMFFRTHGFNKEELTGINIRQIDLNATEEWQEWLDNEMKQRKFVVFESTHYRKDGTELNLEVHSTEISVGNTKYNLSVERDITERKQNEEALRLSDVTLKSINEAVIAIDNENRVTFWNDMSEELFGIKGTDAIGKELLELITVVEEYPGQGEERQEKLWGSGHNREEQLYRTPNGDIWVDAHAQAIEDTNGRHGWVILASDITERIRMETALRSSEEKFSEIFYASPKPMTIIIPDTGTISDVNTAFLESSGFTREECLGKTITELGLWISQEERSQFIRKILEKANVRNFETKMRIKSGDAIDVLLSTTMITISDKPYVIISSDDITENKRMQENLIVTDRLASVGELAAGIAHELNNPLTGVVGFSDLLLGRDDLPEDIREDLDMINREAIRASQVARHLLTFSRKHPDEKKPLNINDVIKLVMELRAYEQRVNNIEVALNLDENLPNILANDFQLQQVFINIIINAEHFMIASHGNGKLIITTGQGNGNVRVTIADDGPGILPEHLNRIFDPFYTTKEVGKGTGLGLSICYGIITEHGGRIWAESEIGEGATFIIELPAHPTK